jgi:hypothetical protein
MLCASAILLLHSKLCASEYQTNAYFNLLLQNTSI